MLTNKKSNAESEKIFIFDLDGTLTRLREDLPANPHTLDTFGFWPLMSRHFTRNIDQMNEIVHEWDHRLDKGTGATFIQNSFETHQRVARTFRSASQQEAIDYAQSLTHLLQEQGGIHLEAIEYIRYCLKSGALCILTTGSYVEAAQGFILGLIEQGLLPNHVLSQFMTLGTEMDWERSIVKFSNVGDHKLLKIKDALSTLSQKPNLSAIRATFMDDPFGNDASIYQFNPNIAYILSTHQNQILTKQGLKLTTWPEILKEVAHVD